MIVSEKWIRSFLDSKIEFAKLAESLTALGIESGPIENFSALPAGLVAARIEKIVDHPNKSDLKICSLNTGSGPLIDVVCGAPNIKINSIYALAKEETKLDDERVIRKKLVHGVKSHGMLCSESELSLSDNANSIMELDQSVPPGTSLNIALDLPDKFFEVELTPNRGDCLSVYGIAREASGSHNGKLNNIKTPPNRTSHKRTHKVLIKDSEKCPKYIGIHIKDVDITCKTPDLIRERLRRTGLRSVDPVVDITNYVMIEIGQPMHAFDADKVKGSIVVRNARKKESIVLLDDTELILSPDILIIADTEGPLAIAGVKGGKRAMVTPKTKTILLEAAFFRPSAIAKTSRIYNISTDASHRFERGVDYLLPEKAIRYATKLIQACCGGKVGPVFGQSVADKIPKRKSITLRKEKLQKVLGVKIHSSEINKILKDFNFNPKAKGKVWAIKSPTYRFDIQEEHDLIEEIARVKGYDNLPSRHPQLKALYNNYPETVANVEEIKDLIIDRGYSEVITYSFVDPLHEPELAKSKDVIQIKNPISEKASKLRTTLVSSMTNILGNNIRRQEKDLKIFEHGNVFFKKNKLLIEETWLSGLITGRTHKKTWSSTSRAVDYYDIKGDVEAIIARCFRFKPAINFGKCELGRYVIGQSSSIFVNDRLIGWVGKLSKNFVSSFNVHTDIFAFELKWDEINKSTLPRFKPISRFPSITRDISVILPLETRSDAITKQIKKLSGNLLIEVILIDLYQGKNIEIGKKSLTYRLTLQSDYRNLTDGEADEIIFKIISSAEEIGGTVKLA